MCDAQGLHTHVHAMHCTLCSSSPLPPGIPVQFPWCTSSCKPECASAVHSFDAHLEDARGLHTHVRAMHCLLCSTPLNSFAISMVHILVQASLCTISSLVRCMRACTRVCTQSIARFAPPPLSPQFIFSFHTVHPRASLSVHQEHTCVMHEGLHTRVHAIHCTLCFSSPLPPNSFSVSTLCILVQALSVHQEHTCVMHEGCTRVCTPCIAHFAPPPPFPPIHFQFPHCASSCKPPCAPSAHSCDA